MRQRLILLLQKFLRLRYNKQIVEIQSGFRDMRRLLGEKKVRVIVDGGAYHGVVAQELSALYPSADVYAFEPYSLSFARLQETALHNRRIHPVRRALSSVGGVTTLYVNAQDSTNALSPVAEMGKRYQSWQTQNVRSESIDAIRLDSWTSHEGIRTVDLLKLDLQGHELEALRGAKRLLGSSIRLIYAEVEFVKVYEQNCLFREVEAYLSGFGFRLYQLYNFASGDDNQLVCADAIFIHPERL